MTLRRLGSLLFLFVSGCSSSGSTGKSLPTQAEIQAFTRASNIFVVPVDVDGTTALLGVDTGDPFVLLDPASFPPLSQPVGTASTVSVASQTFTDVPVITSSQSPSSGDSAVPFGGLFGCFILCSSVATFNYRDVMFTLGGPPTITDVLPEIQLPFALEGGGSTQDGNTTVTVPTSRVVVSVQIEQSTYRMIVDSGASEVVLDDAAFTALTSDGRAQLSAGGVETASGESSASYARAKTIALGAAQATGVLVAHDTSFDTNIATIATETGEDIRGSLGGSFLEHFNVTIDYPNRTLHLSEYADSSFIFDSAELLGFALTTGAADGYTIGRVFSGSDAEAKGVTAGDVVLAIDGVPLVGLSSSQIEIMLGGKVGSTHAVQFGAAQNVANRIVTIAVSELLPP